MAQCIAPLTLRTQELNDTKNNLPLGQIEKKISVYSSIEENISPCFTNESSPCFTNESSPCFTNGSNPCFTNESSPGFTNCIVLSPVHVLQISPVQVLQVQSSPGFTTCREICHTIFFFTSENLSYQRFDWLTFSCHLKCNACSQASVNMESDFVNSLRRDLWHFH